MVKLAIVGACGRMGRRIGSMAHEDQAMKVVAAMEATGHADLGKDYGQILGVGDLGVLVSETINAQADVIIDFSSPESSMKWLDVARNHGMAIVIGTTGLSAQQSAAIDAAAKTIPIVQAPNMSVGMNMLFRMLGEVARTLGPEYDIDIIETHHRFKKDAPSGTAMGLLKSVCDGIGKKPEDVANYTRHGNDALRKPGEIGMQTLRLGDTVGEHTVYFGTLGETVSFSHSAHSRDTFVCGALRAAKWLADQKPGRYSMQNVLFG